MDNRREVSVEIIEKFGEESLPRCGCFAQDEVGIDEAGLFFIAQAMGLGDLSASQMIEKGLCPGATPRMTAILVHSLFGAAAQRMASDERYDVRLERMHEEFEQALTNLRIRAREILRKALN